MGKRDIVAPKMGRKFLIEEQKKLTPESMAKMMFSDLSLPIQMLLTETIIKNKKRKSQEVINENNT